MFVFGLFVCHVCVHYCCCGGGVCVHVCGGVGGGGVSFFTMSTAYII